MLYYKYGGVFLSVSTLIVNAFKDLMKGRRNVSAMFFKDNLDITVKNAVENSDFTGGFQRLFPYLLMKLSKVVKMGKIHVRLLCNDLIFLDFRFRGNDVYGCIFDFLRAYPVLKH